jgi:hypothetical protein
MRVAKAKGRLRGKKPAGHKVEGVDLALEQRLSQRASATDIFDL